MTVIDDFLIGLYGVLYCRAVLIRIAMAKGKNARKEVKKPKKDKKK